MCGKSPVRLANRISTYFYDKETKKTSFIVMERDLQVGIITCFVTHRNILGHHTLKQETWNMPRFPGKGEAKKPKK